MARLRDFFDAVNVVMPGVAIPIVEPVLRYVLEDFCSKSRKWQVLIVNPDMDDATTIDFAAIGKKQLESLDVKMVDVLRVFVDGVLVDKEHYPWERITRKGIKWKMYVPHHGEISVIASVKPTTRCKEFDDDIYEDWRDTIAYGVAARLQLQPNKDWSDTNLAMYHEDKYNEGRNQALFEANNHRNTITKTP